MSLDPRQSGPSQGDLFSLAPTHATDGIESRIAASRVDARRQLDLVLVCLYHAEKPLTDDELGDRLNLKREHAGTRRGVAVKNGWAERAGRSVTPRGNPCGMWRLTAEGRLFAEGIARRSAA